MDKATLYANIYKRTLDELKWSNLSSTEKCNRAQVAALNAISVCFNDVPNVEVK